MILLIDNYDSFTWNLYQYFCELGAEVVVRRNDELSLSDIETLAPQKIVISPGPCTPSESGISLEVIHHYAGRLPILGVCLGHQTIGYVAGATVKKGTRPMHGKLSPLTHSGEGLFRGLPQDFLVTRYHSLVIDEATLPQEYQVDARTEDQAVMAISHRTYPIYGVQFHPEAVLTQYGHELLENFHCICQQWQQERTEVCYA